MYGEYGSRSRERDSYRSRSPRRRDDWDRDHYRSRNEHSHQHLPYDDYESHGSRGLYDGSSRGGYAPRGGSDRSPRRGAGGDGPDWDRADAYDDGGDGRDSSRGRYRRQTSSRTIIIHGLVDDATEQDILYGLDRVSGDPTTSTEQVRVVRIRSDRRGRRFALAEFYRAADAEYFVDKYRPAVTFPLEHSRGADSQPLTFDIDFAPRDDGDRYDSRAKDDLYDDGWECRECRFVNYPGRYVCFKCKAERLDGDYREYDGRTGPILTGETDECPQQSPSQYVVVRDLGDSVTEEVLAKGMMKLFLDDKPESAKETPAGPTKLKSTAPTNSTEGLGARPGTLRRVFLMRDRRTDESWRYGFAEFATIDDAKAAVAKFQATNKFSISSKPAIVAFIHTGVFVPTLDAPRQEDERDFSFTPVYNPSLRLKYWDDRGYPSALVVSADPVSVPGQDGSGNNGGKSASGKSASNRGSSTRKSKKEKDPLLKPITMAPQMQMWAKKAAELHGKHKAGTVDPLADDGAVARASGMPKDEDKVSQQHSKPDTPRYPLWNDEYLSYADWDNLRCLVCDREAPPDKVFAEREMSNYSREQWLIDHEVKVHNHYKDEDLKQQAAQKLAALGRKPRRITRRTPRLQGQPAPTYKSYADLDTLICHLCSRQFRRPATLLLHEQESELHRRMLADTANVERATAALLRAGKTPMTMVPKSASRLEQQRYRDRALERRLVFNQPRKPGAGGEKRKDTAAAAEMATPEAAADDQQAAKAPAPSKGAGMLAKMGWTAGAGLGAEGLGRTEAVATEAYAPGVGLGAEGGRLGDAGEEARRRTRGDGADFVEKTRDRARERFEKLAEGSG